MLSAEQRRDPYLKSDRFYAQFRVYSEEETGLSEGTRCSRVGKSMEFTSVVGYLSYKIIHVSVIGPTSKQWKPHEMADHHLGAKYNVLIFSLGALEITWGGDEERSFVNYVGEKLMP